MNTDERLNNLEQELTNAKRRSRWQRRGAILSTLLGLLACDGYGQSFTVTDLGNLGGTSSIAYCVNELGQVVGSGAILGPSPGQYASTGGYAFLWTNGVMTRLAVPSGYQTTSANGINDSGLIVGWAGQNGYLYRTDAIIWYPNGSLTNLTYSAEMAYSQADGINNEGQVVGWVEFINSANPVAFSWQNSGWALLGLSGSYGAYGDVATHVNNLGQVAGYQEGGGHAFVWQPGITTNMLFCSIPSDNGAAYSINDSGDVVGVCGVGAALWKSGQQTSIWLDPNPTNGIAFSINNSGFVVGITAGTNGTYPFLWDCGSGLRDLNTLIPTNSGWMLTDARCINNHGQVVGQGIIGGQTNAFLLNPISPLVITDTIPPVITCPANITTQVLACVESVAVSFPAPVASDLCSTTAVVCVPPSGSFFPVGTNTVNCVATDESGNTNWCNFTVAVIHAPRAAYDLAVTKIIAPRTVTLTRRKASQTKFVKVQVQNVGTNQVTISNLGDISSLVAESLGTNCPNATVALHVGAPQRTLPLTLKPKQQLTIVFDVLFNCANDSRKSTSSHRYDDFSYKATIRSCQGDANPTNDVCPRPTVIGPGGEVLDAGCGNRKPDGTLGADVVTDIVVK